MAMTVKMRTEKTKNEKHRLLISLIRFWPIGSALLLVLLEFEFEFESFIFVLCCVVFEIWKKDKGNVNVCELRKSE